MKLVNSTKPHTNAAFLFLPVSFNFTTSLTRTKDPPFSSPFLLLFSFFSLSPSSSLTYMHIYLLLLFYYFLEEFFSGLVCSIGCPLRRDGYTPRPNGIFGSAVKDVRRLERPQPPFLFYFFFSSFFFILRAIDPLLFFPFLLDYIWLFR
ncbi:hypothetical protein F5Y14DRAFT_244432 [Nemania sp. NC0429]|nr:hypothetical protein F5Y14DRAFT_244432 [Nemania sp. NC0429]